VRGEALGGSSLPETCEKPTPPRSNSLPSSRMQVVPPPPSARCQVVRHEAVPSRDSSAATMRACSAVK
jgi:hypothetical protein